MHTPTSTTLRGTTTPGPNVTKDAKQGAKADARADGAPRDASATMRRFLGPLASLRLTVVLFAFGLVLVLLGTVVQVEKGIWDVMDSVFRTWIARIELSPFFPDSMVAGTFLEYGWFPFPGGWLIGSLLLANLVAAHAVRFKLVATGGNLMHGVLGTALGLFVIVFAVLTSVYEIWPLSTTLGFWPALMVAVAGLLILTPPSFWLYGKRTGIVLLHAGIILLLFNELVTGLGAVEGQAHILQGDNTNFLVDIESAELVIVHKNYPGGEKVVSIPEAVLHKGGKIEYDGLPFGVEVLRWYPNTALVSLFASDEIAGVARQVLQPLIDQRISAARKAADAGEYGKAVAIYDHVLETMTPRERKLIDVLLAARQRYAVQAIAMDQDPRAAEMPAFDDLLSLEDIIIARKLASGLQEPLTDEDIAELARFFDTFDADREGGDWLNRGRDWQRYHARGGDAGRLWVRELTQTEPDLAAEGEKAGQAENALSGDDAADQQKADLHHYWRIRHIAPGAGVSGGQADMPGAYVRITGAGDSSGVYLVHSNLPEPNHKYVSDGGRLFHTSLRFKRMYKPYTIHLLKFRHDKYTGTSKAKNFSSEILLIDEDHPDGLHHTIRMNDPLRYKGETFFQASFKPDDSGTVLQVVRNPGYLLPYIACIVVTMGLGIHFGQTLRRFLRKATP